MSRNYKFKNPEGAYFVSFAVVEWVDALSRNVYKDIIVESLRYCQKHKGLEIFSWVIMSNHVHLIIRAGGEPGLSDIMRDFKTFTAKQILKAIRENPRESRKDWMLSIFRQAGAKTSNVKTFQFWRHDNKPIEVWSNHIIRIKLNYIHQNPVEAGLVQYPEDYLYSSAKAYAGEPGMLDVILVDR